MIGLIIGDIAGMGAINRGVPAYGNGSLFHEDSVYSTPTVLAWACAEWLVFSGEKGIVSEDRLGAMVKEKATINNWVEYSEDLVKVLFTGGRLPTPTNESTPEICLGLTPFGEYMNDREVFSDLLRDCVRMFSSRPKITTFSRVYSLFIYFLQRHDKKYEAGNKLYNTIEALAPKKSFNDLEKEDGDPEDPEDVFLRALAAFVETNSFEDAIMAGVMLNVGNSNVSALAGAFAEAHYKEVPHDLITQAMIRLPEDARQFVETYYNGLARSNPKCFRDTFENL